jgi:hypothetical protein
MDIKSCVLEACWPSLSGSSREVALYRSDEGYSSAEDIMIIFYDYLSDRAT